MTNDVTYESAPGLGQREPAFNGLPDTIENNLPYLDDLGSPLTYNHYPTGWAWAFNTTDPAQLTKPRNRYVYDPGCAEVPESVAPNIRNRSYTVAAEVDIESAGGTITMVAVDVSSDPFVDLAAAAKMAFARD